MLNYIPHKKRPSLRENRAAFLTFAREIILRQDFTGHIDHLDQAVNKINEPGRQTSLYDAVWQFCDEKLRSAPGRRALVVMSDGPGTSSQATLEDAIDIAQRTEIVVFIVSTNAAHEKPAEPGKPNLYDQAILKLAAETGGKAFFAGSMIDLEKSFAQISQELDSYYVVTYRPANQKYSGKQRRIEIRFRDQKKTGTYQIRAKTKYRMLRDALK